MTKLISYVSKLITTINMITNTANQHISLNNKNRMYIILKEKFKIASVGSN